MKDKNYNHEYYLKNKKRILRKSKLYGNNHKEERRAWHMAWAKKHPNLVKAHKAKFRVLRRKINKRSIILTIELLEKLLLII